MSNYGLIRTGTSKVALLPIPVPKVRDDGIVVKTVAIALSPTDWTSLDAVGNNGVLNGCDYAGVVVEVGSKVQKFKKGDRVSGFSHGANDADPETGSFAQYILAIASLQIHIPDDVTFEDAVSTCGGGLATTGIGLYQYLGLPSPETQQPKSVKTILIYGASTATGSVAIQFARLSGWKVVTLCAPKHFPMVKERGCDAVYDYRIPNIGEQIRQDTNGEISDVLDTVAVESSAAICAAAIGPNGGRYVNLLGIDCPRDDVKSEFFLGYSVSGEPYIFEGESYPADKPFHDAAVEFATIAERLWRQGKWKTHPHRVLEGGLLGAIDGMQQMREGRGPSGEKWVYRVNDTAWPS